jgi:hypothetical protein
MVCFYEMAFIFPGPLSGLHRQTLGRDVTTWPPEPLPPGKSSRSCSPEAVRLSPFSVGGTQLSRGLKAGNADLTPRLWNW